MLKWEAVQKMPDKNRCRKYPAARRMKLWAAMLVAILAATGLATPAASALPPIQGQFDLTTLDGHHVTLADFKGKWSLIYFG
jgi:cytochrome oxidase Cu insertion factor (SCO1/SenC/PrrC family)